MPSGGGGSTTLMLTNGTAFNESSTSDLNGTRYTLPEYFTNSASIPWTSTNFFAVFDKVTYDNEDYLKVSTFYKAPTGGDPPILNKYGYCKTYSSGTYFGPYTINIGQGFFPIIYFMTNRITASSPPSTQNEMTFSSKIIDFSNFRLLSFNAPTLTPPFMISDIVYSDDPSTDNTGTSITFTWNNNRYESSYITINGSKYNPNINNGFAFVFYNSPTKYIGLVCNNTVIVWLRGTIPSINSSPVSYGTFNISPLYFNFSNILPNFY